MNGDRALCDEVSGFDFLIHGWRAGQEIVDELSSFILSQQQQQHEDFSTIFWSTFGIIFQFFFLSRSFPSECRIYFNNSHDSGCLFNSKFEIAFVSESD